MGMIRHIITFDIMNMISQNDTQDPFDDLAQFFKQLSHPVRLQILMELQRGEACVCHLEALTGQRQAYLSQQLSILKAAGLIEDHKEGWNVYYRLTNSRIIDLLEEVAAGMNPSGQLTSGEPVDCPCPKCKQKREKQKESE